MPRPKRIYDRQVKYTYNYKKKLCDAFYSMIPILRSHACVPAAFPGIVRTSRSGDVIRVKVLRQGLGNVP